MKKKLSNHLITNTAYLLAILMIGAMWVFDRNKMQEKMNNQKPTKHENSSKRLFKAVDAPVNQYLLEVDGVVVAKFTHKEDRDYLLLLAQEDQNK